MHRPGGIAAALVLAVLVARCDRAPTAPAGCETLTITTPSQTAPYSGGDRTAAVRAPTSCTWAATTTTSWLTISSGAGTGDGAVSFRVDVNHTATRRSAPILVASQTLTIDQDPAPAQCMYSILPARRSIRAAGGGFSVRVTVPFGCVWTFRSEVPWMTIVPDDDGAPNGNGNGTVGAVVTGATGTEPRTGTATIAGVTLTVLQDGTSTSACSYAFSTTAASFGAAGGAGSTQIVTQSNCGWSVDLSQTGGWVTVSGPTSGDGPRTLSYAVSGNAQAASRTAVLMLLTQSASSAPVLLTIAQAGR